MLTTMLLVSMPVDGSPASRERTREAFRRAYSLQFASCYEALEQAAAIDPTDPAPPRAVAAVAWIEALFAQGVATFEGFTGQVPKRDVDRPAVPAELRMRFRTHIGRALDLAEQQVDHAPDGDAYYQLGAAAALSAVYVATVEGRTFGAVREGRRAVKTMERARTLEPRRPEPALVLGMYRYTVSTLSWPVRFLARIVGLSGDRAEGLALLEEAASVSAETETDALLLLMIAYNREGRHAEAAERLARLEADFPRNRLIALNVAATALEAGQFETAERRLSEALETYDLRAPPAVPGEHALWLLKTGTARAAVGRGEEARADLTKALTVGPRDWVRGRVHFELGKLAVSNRDAADARVQLEGAVEFGERGGDAATVREARKLLRPARRQPDYKPCQRCAHSGWRPKSLDNTVTDSWLPSTLRAVGGCFS